MVKGLFNIISCCVIHLAPVSPLACWNSLRSQGYSPFGRKFPGHWTMLTVNSWFGWKCSLKTQRITQRRGNRKARLGPGTEGLRTRGLTVKAKGLRAGSFSNPQVYPSVLCVCSIILSRPRWSREMICGYAVYIGLEGSYLSQLYFSGSCSLENFNATKFWYTYDLHAWSGIILPRVVLQTLVDLRGYYEFPHEFPPYGPMSSP